MKAIHSAGETRESTSQCVHRNGTHNMLSSTFRPRGFKLTPRQRLLYFPSFRRVILSRPARMTRRWGLNTNKSTLRWQSFPVDLGGLKSLVEQRLVTPELRYAWPGSSPRYSDDKRLSRSNFCSGGAKFQREIFEKQHLQNNP